MPCVPSRTTMALLQRLSSRSPDALSISLAASKDALFSLRPLRSHVARMKKQLSKSGRAGWTFIDVLSDFSLLVYLSQFLDAEADMPKILASVADRDVPLDDGYKILISSIAGLDGSY